MFAVVVTFHIRPERRSEFLPLMSENASTSLQDEAGCLRFDVWSDPNRPTEISLYEIYADEASFEVHKKTPHFARFESATTDMVVSKTIATYGELTP